MPTAIVLPLFHPVFCVFVFVCFGEGTDYDLVPQAVLNAHRDLFRRQPQVFSKCFLIHTYAHPYRVGSAVTEVGVRVGVRMGELNSKVN